MKGGSRASRWTEGKQNVLSISHHLYADDTLIFSEPTACQLKYLVFIECFEAVSRLRVNWWKQVNFSQLREIYKAWQLHLAVKGSLPMVLLDLSLGTKHKAQLLQEVWKDGKWVYPARRKIHFSRGAQDTWNHNNSELDSMPTYIMYLFPMTVKVKKRID